MGGKDPEGTAPEAPDTAAPRLPRIAPLGSLRCVLALLSAGYVLLYLGIALIRLRYPFELEWMEGGSLSQVFRILDGSPLYTAPDPDFTPFIYTPLYFLLGSGLVGLLGGGLPTLRLLSLAASVGTLLLLYALVRRETGRPLAGLAAAGTFAAAFPLSGGWYDLARVDSLFLFLLLSAICAFRPLAGKARIAAGVGLLLLAASAKQAALPAALPLLLTSPLWLRRRLPLPLLAFVPAAAGLLLAANHLTSGWFGYYVLFLPGRHAVESSMFLDFWIRDLRPFWPLAVMGMLRLWPLSLGRSRLRPLNLRRSRLRHPHLGGRPAFYISAVAGLVATAWLSRLHTGGYANVLMPAHAALALLLGLTMAPGGREGAGKGLFAPGGARESAMLSLALLQMLLLAYNPRPHLPGEEDLLAGRRLVERISALEGGVFLPNHPYLLRLAGLPEHAHAMALSDVLRAGAGPEADRLRAGLEPARLHGRYRHVLLDIFPLEEEILPLEGLESHFLLQDSLLPPGRVFMPRAGVKIRPNLLFSARQPGRGAGPP